MTTDPRATQAEHLHNLCYAARKSVGGLPTNEMAILAQAIGWAEAESLRLRDEIAKEISLAQQPKPGDVVHDAAVLKDAEAA